MHVRKAVITAAGRGARLYPAADTVQKAMLPLVDRDGIVKPVLQIIAEEALESGIEEICVVCAPGDEAQYTRLLESLRTNLLAAFKGQEWAKRQGERLSELGRRLRFVAQTEPLGYGHAVYCAHNFVDNEPFLLLLSDHLYVSHVPNSRCAQQLIRLAAQESCTVAGVQATREHLVGRYGTVAGKRLHNLPNAYQIERILEKPSLSVAEVELHTPGLRVGHYLCFFGMYVLTPSVFRLLEEGVAAAKAGGADVQLTTALNELAGKERCLAMEVSGSRHDIGAKYGVLQTQIALGLAGQDRVEILSDVAELLAESRLHGSE
ncbi:MAG: NTP transferase domain-containing protein [Candidatus Hydrogenedentes bacterium]|nr:NTP transferase domain-containing protein [Candidatus Hydrogenedentota bacterium]